MRVVHSKRSLPRKWAKRGSGIVWEDDLKLHGHSRLCAKLLVFENKMAMRRFWKGLNPQGASMKGACGVVTRLSTYVIPFQGGEEGLHYLDVDPRYFCVIGLVKGWLSMEVLAHEAVHAAHAYQERTRLRWPSGDDLPEENIAYPTGRAAQAILVSLKNGGLVE